MEYRKDKRTKNLTLRDIHVGDWVQVWSKETERYSPPMKITQICDDGTVYLIISEENRLDPWEENIKDIDALPIDVDLLRGFGFVGDYASWTYTYGDLKIIINDNSSSFFRIKTSNSKLSDSFLAWTFSSLQNKLHEMGYCPKFEWKGVER